MYWVWIGLTVVIGSVLTLALVLYVLYRYLRWQYRGTLARIFQEKPLFIIPRGQPVPGAEDVHFRFPDRLGELFPQPEHDLVRVQVGLFSLGELVQDDDTGVTPPVRVLVRLVCLRPDF